MPGTNNCPFASDGYLIFILGQRFNRMASLISVNEPLISAWLAMMAALVAIIIPGKTNQSGMIP